ncbi:MAG: hypothetical protein PF570_03475 [Candidatus Cloacimonetes bacterium]|jgi:hypothetical protein|nr:hypothetical protein [Candidatus Cloacimonadota bacterium]
MNRLEIKALEDLGYTTKDAIRLTAERYYLAEYTVRDLVYKQPKNIDSRSAAENE